MSSFWCHNSRVCNLVSHKAFVVQAQDVCRRRAEPTDNDNAEKEAPPESLHSISPCVWLRVCADSYRQRLCRHGIAPHMSRKGNGGDNAVAERCFHTLKTEVIPLEDFDTHAQAQTRVFEYIEVFSNRQRCHSANGSLAPLAYEETLKTIELLCPEKW